MICLDNTDTLEGGASVDVVVDYTIHGLVGGVFTVLADGQLSSTDPSVLYTAGAGTSIVSVTFVNTHSAAVNVNLYLDSANGGNPRRMIPKDCVLNVGSSLHFDGQRCGRLEAGLLSWPMIIWRLILDRTDADPLGGGGTDWEIADDTENEDQLGDTAVTESSGIFSFTSTGYWNIRAYAYFRDDVTEMVSAALKIKSTDDNNTYSEIVYGGATAYRGSGARVQTVSTEALIKVEDITLDKIKLVTTSGSASTYVAGTTTENWTYIVFEKKASL